MDLASLSKTSKASTEDYWPSPWSWSISDSNVNVEHNFKIRFGTTLELPSKKYLWCQGLAWSMDIDGHTLNICAGLPPALVAAAFGSSMPPLRTLRRASLPASRPISTHSWTLMYLINL